MATVVLPALLAAGCSRGSDGGASTVQTVAPPVPADTLPAGSSPAGSSPAGSAPADAEAAPAGPLAFTTPGPYPVGTLEIEAPNGPITVWYPGEPGQEAGREKASYDMRTFLPEAEQGDLASVDNIIHTMDAYQDLPAAEPISQPFPLVLFSHGFCGYRQQSSFLTTTIASWGFVVAAPEHGARDLTACLAETIGQGASTDIEDLRAAIPVLEAENLRDEGLLATVIDTGRVAVVGHSAGGSAAIQMTGDPQVVTFVALAAGGGIAPPTRPGLFVAGEADVIAPAAAIEQWWTAEVPSPKQLAVLGGVTHLGFMDACTIASDQGGMLEVAAQAGVAVPDVIARLYADGCDPEHTPAEAAWPAIRHLTIAQLRAAFAIDAAPVALDASLTDAYNGLTVRYQSA